MTDKNNNEEFELEKLRWFLREWRHWLRDWFPGLGYPSAVPYLDNMRPSVSTASEEEESIDGFAMRIIDVAVESLPAHEKIAVRLCYLNEIGPSVWRSARMPMKEITRLCEAGERRMIPFVKSRGLVL